MYEDLRLKDAERVQVLFKHLNEEIDNLRVSQMGPGEREHFVGMLKARDELGYRLEDMIYVLRNGEW